MIYGVDCSQLLITKVKSARLTNPSRLPTTSPFCPTGVDCSQWLITKVKSARLTILSQLASPNWGHVWTQIILKGKVCVSTSPI